MARYKSNVVFGYTWRVLAFIFLVFFLRCLSTNTKQRMAIQGIHSHLASLYIPHNLRPYKNTESKSEFSLLFREWTMFVKHTHPNPNKFSASIIEFSILSHWSIGKFYTWRPKSHLNKGGDFFFPTSLIFFWLFEIKREFITLANHQWEGMQK